MTIHLDTCLVISTGLIDRIPYLYTPSGVRFVGLNNNDFLICSALACRSPPCLKVLTFSHNVETVYAVYPEFIRTCCLS